MLHSCKPFSFATIAVDAVCLDNLFLSDREDPSLKKQPSHVCLGLLAANDGRALFPCPHPAGYVRERAGASARDRQDDCEDS
jgi:hypothetical protein